MKTVAATAATGELRPYAARLATRWARLNDSPCLDLSDVVPWADLRSPTWRKTLLWELLPKDVDRVLWLDADVFPTRAVAWYDAPDAPFTAVPDDEGTFENEKIALRGVAECDDYFNAGVFIATRKTEAMFREWKGTQHAPNVGTCGDQGWANCLVQKYFGGFAELFRGWNWMMDCPLPRHLYHVHFAGMSSKRLRVIDAMETMP